MDYKQIIEENYAIKIRNLHLIDCHFGTYIYRVECENCDFFCKVHPSYDVNLKNEYEVTEFLYRKGFKVARILKPKSNDFGVMIDQNCLTLQEFINGTTLEVNTASDWFMKKSSELLGQMHMLLCDYKPLPIRFGKDFFRSDTAEKKKSFFEKELESEAQESKSRWETQIAHLDRINTFCIDTDRLTYANSHGDYHIGQSILQDEDVTIIDWSSVCSMPVSFEIITSYVFASPKCKCGAIDAGGLSQYINEYRKFSPLSRYDIETMPYVFYFWHTICNYLPSEEIPKSYQPISKLINSTLSWLYDNADKLSYELLNKLTI